MANVTYIATPQKRTMRGLFIWECRDCENAGPASNRETAMRAAFTHSEACGHTCVYFKREGGNGQVSAVSES